MDANSEDNIGYYLLTEHIGYLLTESHTVIGLCCQPQAPLYDKGIRCSPLFRVNIGQYRQTCHRCGATLVEPATPAWPELFRKRHEQYLRRHVRGEKP